MKDEDEDEIKEDPKLEELAMAMANNAEPNDNAPAENTPSNPLMEDGHVEPLIDAPLDETSAIIPKPMEHMLAIKEKNINIF